jgi:hypothetical protein
MLEKSLTNFFINENTSKVPPSGPIIHSCNCYGAFHEKSCRWDEHLEEIKLEGFDTKKKNLTIT